MLNRVREGASSLAQRAKGQDTGAAAHNLSAEQGHGAALPASAVRPNHGQQGIKGRTRNEQINVEEEGQRRREQKNKAS